MLGLLCGILAACSEASEPRMSATARRAPVAEVLDGIGYAGPSAHGATAAEASGNEEAETASTASRKLIQTAELEVQVESCEEARRAIDEELARVGGFVASAHVTHRENRISRAVLVLRIPVDALGSSLAFCSSLGDVVRESLAAQDITEEYFDLESRLGTARKLEARLLELVETEAQELKDLLEVERELARVRETIERHEGKLRRWKDQVALSTLTVELETRARVQKIEPPSFGVEVGDAFQGSIAAMGRFARTLLLVAVTVLPWLVPLALLGWLSVRLLRRSGSRP